PQEWEQRFGRERISLEAHADKMFFGDFAVESYLENHANKFTGRFDANCYLYLSRASDLFDFAEHGGSLEAAFAQLNVDRAMVIGVESDILFPIRQQQELAAGLSNVVEDVELVELDCIKGHDSFLVDMDAFRPVISRFLT
ncbi:MAG: homoserine O-acetyltransferase, partial [Pseudomonadota bacterium]|nr:homoserine O-acetyltransferase [Pseudomonadota bacterium]